MMGNRNVGIRLEPFLLRSSKRHVGFIHAHFLPGMSKWGTLKPAVSATEQQWWQKSSFFMKLKFRLILNPLCLLVLEKARNQAGGQVVWLFTGAFLLFDRTLLTFQWANELSLSSSTVSSYMTNNAGFSMTRRIAVDDRSERPLPGIFICREISREALLHPHPIPVSILFWLAQHPHNPIQENRQSVPQRPYNLKWGKV